MFITILDYGSGNLLSCAKAFEKAAPQAHIEVAGSSSSLKRASHIVLPGVGAFGDCMRGLDAVPGMRATLEEEVRHKKKPFLGICLGMQMMMQRGFEHGEHEGLGWLAGEVVRIQSPESRVQGSAGGQQSDPVMNPRSGASLREQEASAGGTINLKIPHMGWNDLEVKSSNHLTLREIRSGDHAYFVHSYHVLCQNPSHVLATVDYGGPIAAIIGSDNMLGTQFHPEKSQETGQKLIQGFLLHS